VRTGSGCLHVYVIEDTPTPHKRKVHAMFEGREVTIDLLVKGAQAVAPPTPGYTLVGYEDRLDAPPLSVPSIGEAWANLARHLGVEEIAPPASTNGSKPPIPDKIPTGARHDTFIKIAGSLRRQGAGADEIAACLAVFNERCAEPSPPEDLEKLAQSAATWQPHEEAPAVVFVAVSAEAFLAEEIADPDAIIGDGGDGAILSPGEKLMIAGPPGVGKTNIGLGVGSSLAAGQPVLTLPCPKPVTVLYAALEGNRKRLQKRLRKVLRDTDEGARRRLHFARIAALDLGDDRHVAALEDLCRLHQIEVLILDPLRDAHRWGEDKSEDAAQLMAVLDSLMAVLPRLAVVLVHHVRKPDPRRLNRAEQTLDQIRGSYHLVAAMQSVLLVNEDPKEPDKLLADWVKHRDAEARLAPMFLHFDRPSLSYEVAERPSAIKVTPEDVVAALLNLDGYSEGQAPLMQRVMADMGCSDRTATDAIRDAVGMKLIMETKAPAGSTKKKAYQLLPDGDQHGHKPRQKAAGGAGGPQEPLI